MDVLDPTDPKEIADKLNNQDFASFVVTQESIDDPSFSYQPYIEDE